MINILLYLQRIRKSEGDSVPFFIQTTGFMVIDELLKILTAYLPDKGLFLVEAKILPGKILVLIDKQSGVTIDECVALSRHLYKELEHTGIFEKSELEVGSPGMDQPFKVLEQYKKRIGRKVRVVMQDGQVHSGVLRAVQPGHIDLLELIKEKKEGKKTERQIETTLLLQNIKETKLELK